MKPAKHAFTLVELAAASAILSLVLSISAASVFRAKELSRRMVCSVNLKGIGAAAKVYAAANDGKWMIPGFMNAAAVSTSNHIEYLPTVVTHSIPPRRGEVGYRRFEQSESEDSSGAGGSLRVTTTRAFWMLVRSGAVTVEQFICPSALDDTVDRTENIELYYDFESYNNISYGYQVPFGPTATQPREGADPKRIHAADKGPFYFPSSIPNWNTGSSGQPIRIDDSPRNWRRLNSPNHGGFGLGEGQNVLFADGSVSFARIPAVGADNDNIYTVMTDIWDSAGVPGKNRIHGDTPHQAPNRNPYPGEEAFNSGPNGFAATDSLIFP